LYVVKHVKDKMPDSSMKNEQMAQSCYHVGTKSFYKKQDDSALQDRVYFYSMPNFEHTIACTKYKGVRHDMYYENVV